MIATLYYVHDPMCSWCWAFRPVWQAVKSALPDNLDVRYLLGGLAPDSDDPMPQEMRDYLQQAWRRIESVVPGTEFNFDFWTHNTPRRSTYPACRAVIAARSVDSSLEEAMILAIQQAYYKSARNPSDEAVLTALAVDLGISEAAFQAALHAPATAQQLQSEIREHQRLGSQGFPSLILEKDGRTTFIQHSYTDRDATLQAILSAL